MEKINTKSGNILCVEAPEGAHSIKFLPTGDLIYKIKDSYKSLFNVMKGRTSIRCKLIGKLSDLTDKDCEEFVTLCKGYGYRNYNASDYNGGSSPFAVYAAYHLKLAKQSFITLLQSEGIDTSNEDKLLIIKIIDEDS